MNYRIGDIILDLPPEPPVGTCVTAHDDAGAAKIRRHADGWRFGWDTNASCRPLTWQTIVSHWAPVTVTRLPKD